VAGSGRHPHRAVDDVAHVDHADLAVAQAPADRALGDGGDGGHDVLHEERRLQDGPRQARRLQGPVGGLDLLHDAALVRAHGAAADDVRLAGPGRGGRSTPA
jgi:hypothetical protein